MKTVGIITEYNPFHQGHLYQINYIRKHLQADYIVIAMSGDFVQRGTPALLSKHLRAEMALLCGADLILELPVSVSSSSAEFFAGGGVSLLDGIGVTDMLCFGSEEGSIPLFLETAEILNQEPEDYRLTLQEALKNGSSFPVARSKALLAHFGKTETSIPSEKLTEFLSSPNNILGIEYCRAISRQNSCIQPVTLKREGAGYHETSLNTRLAPSASGIRTYLKNHPNQLRNVESIRTAMQNQLPEQVLSLFAEAVSRQTYLLESDFDSILHYRLLLEDFDSLCSYLDMSPELASRILKLRNQYRGFTPFTELLKTRELTYTRIQRALLHMVLQVTRIPSQIPYARILGFRKSAGPLLKAIKKEGRIPLLSKLADAKQTLDDEALALLHETTLASNIYESLICKKSGRNFIHEYEKPIIFK